MDEAPIENERHCATDQYDNAKRQRGFITSNSDERGNNPTATKWEDTEKGGCASSHMTLTLHTK